MTSPEFYKAFYETYKTFTSEASKLVLVNKAGNNEAARNYNVDAGGVSRMVNRIKKNAPE